ncbi:phytanoyl-CoA dioxygenase family protein [Paenibacillus koleovorans]|uniref:phytanoyl-CoA dioxygenase family protein n=1 Tax=Paenibacillus koleovorans TaxID=121608 RepID=UPI000FDAB676|nr:phytanoyl-CoA dioxygenase family protein [Paenibacillus koleovorans]
MAELKTTIIRKYEEDGYVHVPAALSPIDLEPMRGVVARAVDQHARDLLAEGVIADLLEGETFERRLAAIYQGRDIGLRDWNDALFGRELYELVTHPGILDVLEQVLGPEISFDGAFHLRPKLPESKLTAFPWHQDSQYYGSPTQHMHIVTVTISLVELTEDNGCLWMIPGSHRWGYLEGERGADQNFVTYENVEERHPPVPVPMKLGDIMPFTNLTFHASRINRTNGVRWTLDIRYSPTFGSRPVSGLEREAYEYRLGKLKAGGHVPFVVRSREGRTISWEEWKASVEWLNRKK